MRPSLWTAGLVASSLTALVSAQTFERDIKVTGPRGRTLERKTEIHRGPGGVERDIQISRPSGTYSRQVEVHRTPGFAPRGPVYGPRFVPWGPPPPPPGPSPGAMFGLGVGLAALPAIGFAAAAASRPPVVVAPAPIIAGPTVVAAGPPPIQSVPANAIDPVNLAAQKLYSNFYTSRRDGAIELGRLGDPRAVPALIHVLKYDSYKEVKIAAATSLGRIGGPEAATALERTITYEKKQVVKDAASHALTELRVREARQAEAAAASVAKRSSSTARRLEPRLSASGGSNQGWIPRSSSERTEKSPEPLPALEAPSIDEPTSGDRTPPPPPTPVNP